MPSGSVTLLEASKCSSDPLKRGVVETIIQESPILEMLPQMTIQGNALKHMEEGSLPTPTFRQVNATYSRSWGSDLEHFWGTTILGGEVFVDNYLVKVRGDVIDVKTKQYRKMGKAMARTFDKFFFDGTGTANDFKGVNALIAEGFGQITYAGANGGALSLELLDESSDLMRGQSSADVMLLNRTQRRKITALGRTTGVGYPYLDVGTDTFGRQVTMWNGIPMRIIGDDKDGTAILGYDETRGSSDVTSSIYLLALGEDDTTGLMGLGGSFDVKDFGETEAAPGHLGRVEVYPGIAIFNQYSAVRIAGITNA